MVTKKDDENERSSGCACAGKRWLVSVLGLFGFTCVYSLRINMSMGVLCMVRHPSLNVTNVTTAAPPDNGCGHLEETNDGPYQGEFEWDLTTQSWLLSSFFIGYIFTLIPGGWLAGHYGGKHVYGLGVAMAVLATMLIPVSARTNVNLVFALRVIIGLTTGVTFPAMSAMWGKWAPPLERSKLMTICYSGTITGSILAFSTSGLLCASGVDGGWPLIFYIYGCLGAVWVVLWTIFIYSSPAEDPFVTERERRYIQNSIGGEQHIANSQNPVPWLGIFTSGPVWAILVAQVCDNWGTYVLLTSLPKYMADVLKFDIRSNGLLSAMPYLVQLPASIIGGLVADCLRQRRILSTTATRKIFQLISFIGQATFMVATGHISCQNRLVAVAFLVTGTAFTFGSKSGFGVNHVEVAPRFAGPLFGITNTVATIPGIVAPLLVGQLTPNGRQDEWQKVFYITGGIFLFGAIVFVLLASGEEQAWAKAPEQEDHDIMSKEISGHSVYINKAFEEDPERLSPTKYTTSESEEVDSRIDLTHKI